MPKEFTIDRDRWARGNRPGAKCFTALLTRDGQKCCLGFYLEACGVNTSRLLEMGLPSDLNLPEEANWLLEDVDSERMVEGVIAEANDTHDLSEVYREHRVAALFAAQGITVHFVGGNDEQR
jgi:hypothetical protein